MEWSCRKLFVKQTVQTPFYNEHVLGSHILKNFSGKNFAIPRVDSIKYVFFLPSLNKLTVDCISGMLAGPKILKEGGNVTLYAVCFSDASPKYDHCIQQHQCCSAWLRPKLNTKSL